MKKEEAGKEDKPEQVSGEGKEAVAFAEWLAGKGINPSLSYPGQWYGKVGTILKSKVVTSHELYQLYLESKKGELNHSK